MAHIKYNIGNIVDVSHHGKWERAKIINVFPVFQKETEYLVQLDKDPNIKLRYWERGMRPAAPQTKPSKYKEGDTVIVYDGGISTRGVVLDVFYENHGLGMEYIYNVQILNQMNRILRYREGGLRPLGPVVSVPTDPIPADRVFNAGDIVWTRSPVRRLAIITNIEDHPDGHKDYTIKFLAINSVLTLSEYMHCHSKDLEHLTPEETKLYVRDARRKHKIGLLKSRLKHLYDVVDKPQISDPLEDSYE